MLDGLFGSKFTNKCKHSIKCTRTRLDPIRKKKQAVVRYLRRDVAELLSHGHDLNAYGRMEGLIVEANQSSCYDMIEQYCADVLNQLSVLQKQRECPDEAKEAIATLIFAAARFSDLPELCDLRRAFNDRFGDSMEPFVNSEFVKSAQEKTFSDEKKLRLMQEIAHEFSVRFDPKDVQRRSSNPAEAKYNIPQKPVAPSPRNEESYIKVPKNRAIDIPREKRPNPSPAATVHKQEVRTEQVVWHEPRELLRAKQQQVMQDAPKEPPRAEPRAQPSPSWARPREPRAEPRDVQAEPKDIHVVPPRPERRDMYHRDYKLPAEDVPKKYREKEGSYSVDGEKKRGLASVKSLSEKDRGGSDDALVFDRSRVRGNNGSDYIRSESINEAEEFVKPSKGKGIKMAPPYTKPKVTRVGKYQEEEEEEECNGSDPFAAERAQKGERVINMVPPYVKPKHGDSYNERPRPVSVRSKAPKPPVAADARTDDDDELLDETNLNHTPSMRRRHGHRREVASHDGTENDVSARQRYREVHDDGGNGEMLEARHHHLRRHKSQGTSAKYNEEEEEEEEDNAIDYGNLLRGTPRGHHHRKHKERRSSRHEPGAPRSGDEEERMMDKLLMHYSRKGMAAGPEPAKERSRARPPPPPPPLATATRPSMDRVHRAPERASSMPVEQGDEEEAVRLPARATSMQPDLYNGGRRMHPNLPDYDELQARLRALRNA